MVFEHLQMAAKGFEHFNIKLLDKYIWIQYQQD